MIERIKLHILDPDWDTALAASKKLIELEGKECIQYFIELLANDSPKVRNLASLVLKDFKAQEALPYLKNQIKLHPGSSGTLTYALESLDCSEEGEFLFDLLFSGSAEAKMSIVSILDEQTLKLNQQEKQKILEKSDKYLNSENVHPSDKETIKIVMLKQGVY